MIPFNARLLLLTVAVAWMLALGGTGAVAHGIYSPTVVDGVAQSYYAVMVATDPRWWSRTGANGAAPRERTIRHPRREV